MSSSLNEVDLEKLSSASSSSGDERCNNDGIGKQKPDPDLSIGSSSIGDAKKVFACKPSAIVWRDLSLVPVPVSEDSAAAKSAAVAEYFLGVSQFTPGTPDLVLHLGADKKGLVQGRAYLHRLAGMECEVTISEHAAQSADDDGGKMLKVKVERKGVLNKSYSFEYQRRRFVLSRTREREDGVTGISRVFIGNYKIVDVDGKKTVATYVTESAGRSSGTLTVADGLDQALEILISLAMCGWREKWRRKKNAGQRKLF